MSGPNTIHGFEIDDESESFLSLRIGDPSEPAFLGGNRKTVTEAAALMSDNARLRAALDAIWDCSESLPLNVCDIIASVLFTATTPPPAKPKLTARIPLHGRDPEDAHLVSLSDEAGELIAFHLDNRDEAFAFAARIGASVEGGAA